MLFIHPPRIVLLPLLLLPALSFYSRSQFLTALRRQGTRLSLNEQIDRQSDKLKYGRGIDHISADLNEGDVIAYQVGTWFVDGTEVGDGSPSNVRYMKVDTVQIVWTHDCEHGLVYGFDLTVADNDGPLSSGAVIKKGELYFITEDEYVQCGPEQILCRIPSSSSELSWKDATREVKIPCVDFDPVDELMIS